MITEYAAYTCEGDTVTLYRLYGDGPVAEIPQVIDKKRVERLADHLFASEMSVMCPPGRLSLARLVGENWVKVTINEYPSVICELDSALKAATIDGITDMIERMDDTTGMIVKELERYAMNGDQVEMIMIPEGVKQIGNYAFYGLYCLREVSFPSSIQRIGWGMFNGCRNTERMVFHLAKSDSDERESDPDERKLTPPIMKEVLDAISNETEAIVMDNEREVFRLRFPEYYEEGKENTPARIIEIIYHGTGHQYRNCFLSRVLQFDRYDDIFPLAAAQENLRTNVPLILNRLRSGPEPKEAALDRYMEYLHANHEAATELILADKEFEPSQTLMMLDRRNYFTSTDIDVSIRQASKARCTPAVSCLMEIKSRRFAGTKRSRYEL